MEKNFWSHVLDAESNSRRWIRSLDWIFAMFRSGLQVELIPNDSLKEKSFEQGQQGDRETARIKE